MKAHRKDYKSRLNTVKKEYDVKVAMKKTKVMCTRLEKIRVKYLSVQLNVLICLVI